MGAAKVATLEAPGASLHYQVRGSGPVLLIIPGMPPADQRVEGHADDAHRALAAVGQGPAHVLTDSISGLPGLELAARHPSATPIPRSWPPWPAWAGTWTCGCPR